MDRASRAIAEEIRRMIHARTLKPGDRLAAEQGLCEQFGVGRATVREALRLLEVAGLIEVRVGGRGGAFVAQPSAEKVADALAALLVTSLVTPAHGTELRAAVEIAVLPLVMARATDQDVRDLLAMLDSPAPPDPVRRDRSVAPSGFHERLAACAHNPAVLLLVRSVGQLAAPSCALTALRDGSTRARGARDHRELVRAVEARDLGHAHRVMDRHLHLDGSGTPAPPAYSPCAGR